MKSFDGFSSFCEIESLDGKWLSPVVDKMCLLLANYALIADSQPTFDLKYLAKPDDKPSDNLKTKMEQTYSKLTDLFRKI
jgi:hypothetical protein